MKVVILAGGRGTRLSEETHAIPKPMVAIGGRPILWHIMRHYASFGLKDFVVACGYKGYVIKEYFANYLTHECDLSIDLGTGAVDVLSRHPEDWRVTLVDTGTVDDDRRSAAAGSSAMLDETLPADLRRRSVGRPDRRPARATTGTRGALATVTAVHQPPRFGALELQDGMVDAVPREAARSRRTASTAASSSSSRRCSRC